MARVVFLLSLLLAPLVFCSGPGCETKCVGEGDLCAMPEDFELCGDSGQDKCPICKFGSYCDDNVCRGIANLGGKCSTDSSEDLCSGGTDKYYTYWPNDCDNSLCTTSLSPFAPGDGCVDEWVVAEDSCAAGGCGDDVTTCPSLAVGANCSAETINQCVGGFCNSTSGLCVALVAAGGDCQTTDQCVATAACIEGKCKQFLTSAVGEPCGYSAPVGEPTGSGDACGGFGGAANADFICQAGLFCDNTGKCASPNLADEGKSCSAGTCTGNTVCVNTSTSCELGPLECLPTVSVTNSKTAGALFNFASCIATNKCPRNLRPFKGKTAENCAQNHCSSQWEDYIDTFGSSSAVALTPAVAVLLVALFSSLLNIF